MKKSLSLLVALAMVFSLLVPATVFAATSQETAAGKLLEELGVLKGDGKGELYLDLELNRQDTIVLLSRLMGAEEEAASHDNTHGWPDVTDPYYNGYISWAKEEGLTIGVGDGSTFGYGQPLSVHELVMFMLRALKYDDVAWNDVPEFAAELGLVAANEDLTAVATRGKMAVITVATLNTPVNGSENTLGVELGLFEPPVPETLEVQSVKALNLKQIEVVFNKEVDEDSATDSSNYDLDTDGDASLTDAKFELLEDGKTVLITLHDDHIADQQEKVELTIEDVQDLDENTLEETVVNIEFLDTTLPKALEAKVIGEDTIKVIFSEPVRLDSGSDFSDAFEVDGGDIFINDAESSFVNNNTEANIVLYTTLEEGTIELRVTTKVEDYAGFSVLPTNFELDVVEDKDAPVVVGYKDAGLKKVTLIFNEDIELAPDYDKDESIYHTNSKNLAAEVTADSIDGNQLTLDFSANELPAGTAYIYIESGAVRDFWNNENSKIVVEVEVKVDKEAPVVKSVKATAQREIEVKFSEDVYDVQRSDFELRDADDKNVRISRVETDGEVVKLFTSDDLNGDYKLTIEDIEDEAGNVIEKTTVTFTVDDVTKPKFEDFDVTVYNAGDNKKQMIRIDFGEKMATSGKYSVADLEKYALIDTSAGKEYVLSDVDDVRLRVINDGESVEIEVPAEETFAIATDGTDQLFMYRVADRAGNATEKLSGVRPIVAASTVDVDYARAVDNNKIEVKFKDELSKVVRGDFSIQTEGGTAVDIVGFRTSKDGGKTIITLTIAEDVYDDATLYVGGAYEKLEFVIKTDNESQNRYGQNLTSGATTIEDKIAPALAEIEVDGEKVDAVVAGVGYVELTFTENINPATVSILSFEVEDYDVVGVVAIENKVQLWLNKYELPDLGIVVTQKYAIQDEAGNTIDDIVTEVYDHESE